MLRSDSVVSRVSSDGPLCYCSKVKREKSESDRVEVVKGKGIKRVANQRANISTGKIFI